jgi:hypothetical protein
MARAVVLWCVALALAGAVWAETELPITEVVLYSSGVGYVQRSGTVAGDAAVQLSFKTEQINDLLKSMVLLDFDGGKVSSVTYGAKDPVSKTLKAFAVNLTDNPTYGQLLNRLRGVPVEVKGAQSATGKIVGVETKKRKVGDEVVETETLTLFTDAGLVKLALDDVQSLRILDDKLNRELQDALVVVAGGLDNARKPVVVSFSGTGTRRVVVAYLTESPIWKTSYRLVMDGKTAVLQGWAVVENTSDADWTNVHLSLVSGRPISFVQDLYTPLYLPRPLVQPRLFASLQPMTYDGRLESQLDNDSPVAVLADEVRNQLTANGEVRFSVAPGKPAPAPPPNASWSQYTLTSANAQALVANTPRVRTMPAPMHTAAQRSVASAATASDLGQAFEYRIKDPVTLPRQQSALLPIVVSPLDVQPVSIYNPAVHAKYPLYGLSLKNTTGTHLMGGPITVYHANVYAGDAAIEDLTPGDERLISYGIDLGVESECERDSDDSEMLAVKLVKGTLYLKHKFVRSVSYTFRVTDAKARTLIVEQPYEKGWTLKAPAKYDERTDNLYRFKVKAEGKAPVKFIVTEEKSDLEEYAVVDLDRDTILAFLSTGSMEIPAEMREALKRVAAKRAEISELERRRGQAQGEIQSISGEQERIRRNMGQLDHGSDLYKRYLRKLDNQETYIETLRKRIEALQAQVNAKYYELTTYVNGLELR